PQLRHPCRIPIPLEWKNAEQQIDIPGQLIGAARSRRPDLRRDVLHNLRIPVEEGSRARADILFDGVRKAVVEPGEIDADDDVRLVFERELKELVEDAFELAVLFQRVEQPDD